METLRITSANLRGASAEEHAALTRHLNAIRAERVPEDPPVPPEAESARWRALPSFADLTAWMAREPGGEVVAHALLSLRRSADNQHLAYADVTVLPGWRRRGLGSRMLACAAERARAEGRRLLMLDTYSRAPSGAAFLTRVGATPGLESHTNQLDLARLDRGLVASWLAAADALAGEYELGQVTGPYPDELLAAVTRIWRFGNDEPHGELEVEEYVMSPEDVRELERLHASGGAERWSSFVRERATGEVVALSEVLWRPSAPAVVEQQMTVTAPRHRGRGLGRLVKAAMLVRLLRERPGARFVRTGNADSNAPMLRINRALGFEPFMATTVWQVELSQVERSLAGAGG